MNVKYAQWILEYVIGEDHFVRGKCAAATLGMVKAFPELKRVAGFAHVEWGSDQHWWCVAPDGTVVDPTSSQFPRKIRYEQLDLDNPVTKSRIPTGKCPECGKHVFNNESFCGDSCSKSYEKYIMSGA